MKKTKKAIFNAAIKVFSIEGYDSATVDEIASSYSVGLSAANTYNVYCIPIKTSAN